MAQESQEPRRARLPAVRVQPRLRVGRGRHPVARCPGARRRSSRARWAGTARWRRSCTRPSRETKLMSPPTNCLSPIGDELMQQGARQLPERDRERGRARTRTRSSTSTRAGMKPRRSGARRRPGARKAARGKAEAAPRAEAVPDAPPEEGVEKIKGHNYFIADRDAIAQGLPGQPVPGGGRPRATAGAGPPTRRSSCSASRTGCRSLFQRGACGITEAIVTHGLAQLPAEPAQGLATGRTHGPARAHRARSGCRSPASPRKRSRTTPTSSRRSSSAAQECGRKLATFIRKRKAARLPGAAAQHLRAVHRGGRGGHRQDHGAPARPHQERVPERSRTRSRRRSSRRRSARRSRAARNRPGRRPAARRARRRRPRPRRRRASPRPTRRRRSRWPRARTPSPRRPSPRSRSWRTACSKCRPGRQEPVPRHPRALAREHHLERQAAPGRAGRPEAEALLLQRLDGEEVHADVPGERGLQGAHRLGQDAPASATSTTSPSTRSATRGRTRSRTRTSRIRSSRTSR